MSLAIKVDEICEVMIGNKWEPVEVGSFYIDSYEFCSFLEEDGETKEEAYFYHKGGDSGICPSGFCFSTFSAGKRFYGPLSSVQAVKTINKKLIAEDRKRLLGE